MSMSGDASKAFEAFRRCRGPSEPALASPPPSPSVKRQRSGTPPSPRADPAAMPRPLAATAAATASRRPRRAAPAAVAPAVALPALPPPPLASPSVPASLPALPPPFVAAAPGLWRERFANACGACFASRSVCHHHAELPLRLLLIGHNPSDHAWASGYPYSNPSNRFWLLMRTAGLVPPAFGPADADAAPGALGLGITDVGVEPGSDAAAFKRPAMLKWRGELYARLEAHLARVAAWAGREAGGGDSVSHAPCVVAFTGVRQWAQLFQPPLAGVAHGPQAARPPGWPLPAGVEVWVLPSSSGRAVMTAEQRLGPYRALGLRVAALPWPRPPPG